MTQEVLLSLGSNIDRDYHLTAALKALRELFGNIDVSPVYESKAVGFTGDAFYNLVVAIQTGLALGELNECLKRIEDDCGRDRGQPKFSSRTLDIDVLTYGRVSGVHEGVSLPRDEVWKHAFVLRPLADLRPGHTVPGHSMTWQALWESFDASGQSLMPVQLRT